MPPETRVCPDCGSTDIGHDRGDVISLVMGTPAVCQACGYSGIFPEVPVDELGEYADAVADRDGPAPDLQRGRSLPRLATGVLLLLLGAGATSSATWGDGLLAGLLALAIGAALLAEELVR